MMQRLRRLAYVLVPLAGAGALVVATAGPAAAVGFSHGSQHITLNIAKTQNYTSATGSNAQPAGLQYTARVQCKRIATGTIQWIVSSNHSRGTEALAACPSGWAGTGSHQVGVGWDNGTAWTRYNV